MAWIWFKMYCCDKQVMNLRYKPSVGDLIKDDKNDKWYVVKDVNVGDKYCNARYAFRSEYNRFC